MTNKVSTTWHDPIEHSRKIAETVNQILDGKLNTNSSFTLGASSATTVISDYRVGAHSVICFHPLTANAATELAAGTMYVTAANIMPRSNQFTITHANNAETDRDFRYTLLGSEIN